MFRSASAQSATEIAQSRGVGASRGGALLRLLRGGLSNLLVVASLGGLLAFGHHTGWKLPKASQLAGTKATEPDDWCPEHSVPESACVECNADLMPRAKEYGFCTTHGVAECVLDHPELAQIQGEPPRSKYDVSRALGTVSRSENSSHDTLHKRRVQLATAESAAKSGIEVDAVRERAMTEAITANGEVTFDPSRVAHLSSRVPGTIAAVFKTVNQHVRPGEILALVDAAQVGQAKAQLLAALVKRDLRNTVLQRIKGAAAGAVPDRAITEAESAYQEAEIAFVSARQALINLGFDLPEHLGGNASQIADDIRFLGIPADALAQLPGTTKTANLLPLRTPYAGVVVSSDMVTGEVVDPNRLLCTVADPESLLLLLSVRQEDSRYVKTGLAVEFRTDDNPQPVSGTISWISPTIDERSRTLRVCVNLKAIHERLRDKTFGTARIILRVEPHAVVVPVDALQSTADAHFVFVRDKDYLKPGAPKVFYARQVRVGARDEQYVELPAGVIPGEMVATKGSPALLAQLLRSSLGAGCGCHEH